MKTIGPAPDRLDNKRKREWWISQVGFVPAMYKRAETSVVIGSDALSFWYPEPQPNTGLGDLMSEDYRVLYVWYYGETNTIEPGITDCTWYVPGTLEQEL